MSNEILDVLFINPGNASEIYQDLANDYSAIETPTWSLLLAQSCRSVGFNVAIIDINAERISNKIVIDRIQKLKPKLICFVVYGQNVNAGTVSMSGAVKLSSHIKSIGINIPIGFIGSYVQALPKKALIDEDSIDFVFLNEGVYALRNILSLNEINIQNLSMINGIAWRDIENTIIFNKPEKVVPNELMDIDLPGYAWDLLPYKEKPLDLYRAPMWHAEYDQNKRSPYAALQTSLGCQFGCAFCMINIINRDDNEEIGVASSYSSMRYWTPEFIIKEFDKLVSLGVETIRIVDEMFLLNKKYYVPLCEMLKERGYGDKLRMWAYSRVDTVTDPERLELVRAAGIKWLCLGIESASRNVRLEVSKGKFLDVDIKRVIEQVHSAGIEVMANYIVGLPGDNNESMQATLDLSIDLCTSGWNTYAAMALPGSQLYKTAVLNGYSLPSTYTGYSFHSYDTLPMPNENLSAAEILKFRDEAFTNYHTNPKFLQRIEKLFGKDAKNSIVEMTKIKLKRKILEN